jgi:Exocyst complex component Sec6
VREMSDLDVVDILQMMDWLEYFTVQMEMFGYETRPCLRMFSTYCEDLLHEYLQRIKTMLMNWFDNIKKQPIEIVEAPDKTLTTSTPEDMFNIIHVQVDVAKEKIPPKYLKDVVNSCLNVLREVQRQSYDQLSVKWRELDPETLCSIINDNQRMQEKCEEFADRVVALVPQTDHREMLANMLQDVSSEYVSIAVSAIAYLSRSVLEDLEEPVYSQLFVLDWENGFGTTLSSIMVATLQDYFQDVQVWLPDYFYSKFVKETFHRAVAAYVMSLRRRACVGGTFHFNSEVLAARKIIVDMEVMQEFFEGYADVLRRGGLKPKTPNSSAVLEVFEPITNLAKIVNCSHISTVKPAVLALYELYGADGLKLVHAAFSSNPNIPKGNRTESIDTATKMFERGAPNGSQYKAASSELYNGLIDLKNSATSSTNNAGGGGSSSSSTGGAASGSSAPAKPKSRFFWSR